VATSKLIITRWPLKLVVSISKLCADSQFTNCKILSSTKLKVLQKTNQHLGWVYI